MSATDGSPETGQAPMFAFGHGLSYTRFSYRDLAVNGPVTRSRASFSVVNIGDRRGTDVPSCT